MIQSPQISICIPTYNGQEYLTQCLESCINQSFTNYEVIICDDGSIDNTIIIIEKYVLKYPNIKFYKNETNLGLVGNWNKCIELANGEWIKFVFQDDYISYDCLNEFAAQINLNNYLIVAKRNFILENKFDIDEIDYYQNKVKTLENTGFYASCDFSNLVVSKLAVQNICLNFIGEPTLCMFKKNAIIYLGLFNNNLKQICDLEFFQRIGSYYGLTYLPIQNCFFRIHNSSTTSKNITTNNYQLSHIEPILLAHCMLYGSNYNKFRGSISLFEKTKLTIYFKLRSYEAFINSKLNTENRLIYAHVAINFNEVAQNQNPSILIKLLLKIIKLKRKLKG